MFEILVFVIILILVIGLCLHHHNMTKQVRQHAERESRLVRQAAEASLNASNTYNPIMALKDSTKAVAIMESMHERLGVERSDALCDLDTDDLLSVLKRQQTNIVQDVMRMNPTFKPKHPLNKEAGYSDD